MLRVLVLSLLVGLARLAEATPSLEALTADAPGCDAARATCLGVHLHVAIGETGPVATAEWIARQLAAANQHFAAIDVGFEIVGIDGLPTSATRVEDRRERSSFGATLGARVLDVFVTGHLDDVDLAGGMIYGVTWRQGTRKFVILSTQAQPRVLAHELGHVFGLPHSTYPISIMNKTARAEPPPESRTFHDDELAKMRPMVKRLVRARVLANRKR